jgi:hypothetical protein
VFEGEFEQAKDKIMMGAERKSMVMSEKERQNTAYHEAGHCIVGYLVPEHDPSYKVSIIPRGRALGVTMFLPEEDRYSLSKRMIVSQICSLFGGRIAEEMTLGPDGITTGASNDIERATKMAKAMVTKWGLSEKLGPLMYAEDDEEVFLGMSAGVARPQVSNETAMKIDVEVRSIIDGPSFSDNPHLVTIAFAIFVARSISFEAPVVIPSGPSVISSAIRPPNNEHIWLTIILLLSEYRSSSGRNIVTPSALPLGMMDTL